MKKLLAASAMSLALVSAANAGGVAEPVMEPVVIVEDTSSSAGGLVVPILALLLIALVLHGGSGATQSPG